MILAYSLTKEDAIQFHYYTGWASPEKKQYRIKYYLKSISSGLIAFLAYFILRKPENKLTFLLIGFSAALIFGCLLSYWGVHVRYKRKIEKFYNNPNNEGLFAKTELNITEYGLTSKDEKGESKFKWDAFVKKIETEGYFYLFLSSAQAVIIPKRVLNAQEAKELSALFLQNLHLRAEFNEHY
jgi:hypothetical protein